MPQLQQNIINELNSKIQQVLLIYEQTRAERNGLKEMLQERDAAIDRLTGQFQELEDKNKKLLLAGAIKASSTDTRDAKLKIGRIVHEIDNCMALLNK